MSNEENIKKFDFNFYTNQLKECSVFNYFNIIKRVNFTDSVENVRINYNKTYKKIETLINPEYFFSLSEKEQLFVLSREASRIMLNHHQEINSIKEKNARKIKQTAQDIVVNNMLLNEYKLEVTDNFLSNLNTVENVFTEQQIEEYPIVKNKGTQYYAVMLERQQKENEGDESEESNGKSSDNGVPAPGKGQGESEQDENGENDSDDEKENDNNNEEDNMQELLEAIEKEVREIRKEDKEKQKALRGEYEESDAGDGDDGNSFELEKEFIKPKITWKKLLKKYIARIVEYDEIEMESFLRRPKRLAEFSDDYFLPETLWVEERREVKKNAYVFLDFSGSCKQYAQRFFNFLDTFPKDIFNVVPHYFTTSVTKIDILDSRRFRDGGTDFQCIENYIQKNINENNLYPDCIIVFTDGEATPIRIEQGMEKRWFIVDVTNNSGKENTYSQRYGNGKSWCEMNFPSCKIINIEQIEGLEKASI